VPIVTPIVTTAGIPMQVRPSQLFQATNSQISTPPTQFSTHPAHSRLVVASRNNHASSAGSSFNGRMFLIQRTAKFAIENLLRLSLDHHRRPPTTAQIIIKPRSICGEISCF
jgi:hypothetical protein